MNKEIKIKLPAEKVDHIQELDCAVQAKQAVLTNLFDMHALDNNTKVIESPVVEKYQEQIAKARVAFEKAKDDIINEFIDEETQKTITSWSINYSTCELVYVTA